jgi:hypothetical protein
MVGREKFETDRKILPDEENVIHHVNQSVLSEKIEKKRLVL